MMKIKNFQHTKKSKISCVPKTQGVFEDAKNLRFLSMNKKGFLDMFGMMHPGLMFLIGLIIGAVIMYVLVSKGLIPTGLLPF